MQRVLLLAGLVVSGLIGCAGPEVDIRHELAPDLPIPAGPIVVMEFEAGGSAAHPSCGGAMADLLVAELRAAGLEAARGSGPGQVAHVDGEVQLDVTDDAAERTIRVRRGGTLVKKVVPTLRRQVTARVVFSLYRDDQPPLEPAAEVREQYDSMLDPRVRGPNGLGRPDDPAKVPTTHTIGPELMAACAANFARMVRPRTVEVRMTMRPAGGERAAKARRLAADGKPEAALEHALAAANRKPAEADAQFNAAVLAEATGDLEQAEKYYRRCLDWKKTDPEARQSLARVRSLAGRERLR
jgi:hypothetical protein